MAYKGYLQRLQELTEELEAGDPGAFDKAVDMAAGDARGPALMAAMALSIAVENRKALRELINEINRAKGDRW